LYLIERHSRLMKMLSVKRPRPSIEIATPAASSLRVNAALVNCAPWTPFCLSSGKSRGVDLLATLYDEREELSRKVAFQVPSQIVLEMIVSFLGCKPSSSDEERLEPFFGHRLTP
jgi:hypothetical protein